ncbi:MAG: universal stress protein [Paracoccaceae bacterium]
MYKNILVPIAFDHEHDRSESLELAKKLAAPDAKITLLHVVEVIPAYAVSYLSEDFLKSTRVALVEEMNKLATKLPGSVGKVVDGHSGRTILDYAEADETDLIIIASHRPEMSDYFLGSTAARVVRHATCAVHVLR